MIINNMFEPSVKIDEITMFINRFMFKRLNIKLPINADNIFIIINVKMVFKNLRFTSFLFISIDIFIIEEMRDIKKYPIISAYVPKYFGKKNMLNIKTTDDIA